MPSLEVPVQPPEAASISEVSAANVKFELKQEQLERLRTLFQSVKDGDIARLEIGKRLYESGLESGQQSSQQDTISRREHKLLILKVADEFGYAKSTLYRWQGEYEISIGVKIGVKVAPKSQEGTPTDCPVCGDHFPSKSKAKKHARKEHPEPKSSYTSFIAADGTELQYEPTPDHPYGDYHADLEIGSRRSGMALTRLRASYSKLVALLSASIILMTRFTSSYA